MKVLLGPPATWDRLPEPTDLTLGVFDGVHRGHRDLLARASSGAGLPAVITFDPHPVEILVAGMAPRLLTTLDERLELLESVGVEVVAVLDLAEVRYLAPDFFVDSVLIDRMHVARLTVGRDFHFGRDRAGNVPLLQRMAADRGFAFAVIDLLTSEGLEISSSLIRDLVEAGKIADANHLLGSSYQLSNTVIDGDKRGRGIGFPTANLRPPPRKVIPHDGVYAAVARLGKERYMAAVNVGRRPTFGGGERLVEAYLLDFDRDVYGERLTLEFAAFIRPELRFENVEDLVSRMRDDVEQTRDIVAPVMD